MKAAKSINPPLPTPNFPLPTPNSPLPIKKIVLNQYFYVCIYFQPEIFTAIKAKAKAV
ncbi:MAG: hypothetical protein KME64_10330 [Scytonematopsis contorta HA4267-MV1]|nr:hypothetical protein [Scytonematopsis contorta HA4267-MV1]